MKLRRIDWTGPSGEGPDEHWSVQSDGRLQACASLWWRNAPSMSGEKLAVAGHYMALDDSAAGLLLRHLEERSREEGCSRIVGPMDGNTWRSYRFITEPGQDPLFFLEPGHSPHAPEQWRAAGFRTLARYVSATTVCSPGDDSRADAPPMDGIRLRPFRIDQWERELGLVHALSLSSFTGNFLYSPIGLEEFSQAAAPLRDRIQPELVLIAEKGSDPVGFVFALPDGAGNPLRRAVLKTVAVLPEHRQSGLGAWLVARVDSAARRLGYARIIHAFMHENSPSLRISSRRGARIFRRYELMAKTV